MSNTISGPSRTLPTAPMEGLSSPPPGSAADKIFIVGFKTTFAMSPKAQDLADKGYAQMKAGNYEAAIQLFDESNALPENPGGNPVAYNRKSVALTHLARFEDAKAAFTAALHLEPGYPNALYNVATQMAREGDFDGALEIFEKGVFCNGDGYIQNAKGDGDLDGLRPEGQAVSKDGYNFSLIRATPKQQDKFAQLTGDAPPAGASDVSSFVTTSPTPAAAVTTTLPSHNAPGGDPDKVEYK